MQDILTYIFESDDLKSLKDNIIKNIQNTSNINVLKKVNKLFELSDDQYENYNNFIIEYFKDHCGYNNNISQTLRQKIKHYGGYKLIGDMFKSISLNDNKNIKYFDSNILINDTDIFKSITEFAQSVIGENDELENDFTNLLKDIGNFNIPGKTAIGQMEFLASMFLNDLNEKNIPSKNKVTCDINTNKYGFEFKVSGARIAGNNEESKPLSSEVINNTFINLIINEFIDDSKETDTQKNKNQYSSTLRFNKDLDKELENAGLEKDLRDYLEKLSKTQNIFRNAQGNEIEKILNPVFTFGISDEKFNQIVLDSLLSQIPKTKNEIKDIEYNYLLDNYPVSINSKITEEGKRNFKHIFLILGLYNYWNAERWNYLILFEKPDKKECTGKYKVIKEPSGSNLIESIDKNIKDICYSGAFPCYGKGTNSQNQAPMIKYKK